LAPSHWPNAAGKINQASDIVTLQVDGQRFPVVDFNTGYCTGERCATHVAAGETTTAFISYDDFNLPGSLRQRPKTLEFSISAYVCSRESS